MCATRPDQQYAVTDTRWEKALKAWSIAQQRMTRDQLFDAVCEIGLGDSIGAPEGVLKITGLTDLQFVAMAYGLLAVMEAGIVPAAS